MGSQFFITTAIDYTNAAPHIGHAYEKILADVIARYRRMKGDEVYFLSGVDQHGQKVQLAAQKAGVPPQQFATEVTEKFISLWKTLGIGYDEWAATSDPRHKEVVQKIEQALYEKGDLYKATHSGFYSVRQEQFLTDKERGPNGEFGPEWGQVIELEEENWYFKLARHRDWLLNLLDSRPDLVTPSFRQVELQNAVERLSGDLCISRPKSRLAWGIELPFDRDFVTYVWFDALINYISFAGYLKEEGSSFPDFEKFWPAVHVIGKDILIPAHGIYWLIMLKGAGFSDDQMPRLLVHGFINAVGGEKMSKSLGNVVDPAELSAKYGSAALRYVFMRDCATGQDLEFSEERLVQRYNSDLANGLGNLLNRTLNMSQRYRGGRLAKGSYEDALCSELRAVAGRTVSEYTLQMDNYQTHAALESVSALVSQADKLVEASAPWKLAKDPEQAGRLDSVLLHLAEAIRIAAILVGPVLPEASSAILAQLNVAGFVSLANCGWGFFADGHQLGAPSPVFPRIETDGTK